MITNGMPTARQTRLTSMLIPKTKESAKEELPQFIPSTVAKPSAMRKPIKKPVPVSRIIRAIQSPDRDIAGSYPLIEMGSLEKGLLESGP